MSEQFLQAIEIAKKWDGPVQKKYVSGSGVRKIPNSTLARIPRLRQGHTVIETARILGLSASTIKKYSHGYL